MHHSKYFEASKRAKNILPSFKISIPIKHQTCPTSTFSSLLHFRLFLLTLGSIYFRLFLFFCLPIINTTTSMCTTITCTHKCYVATRVHAHTCTHLDLVSTEHDCVEGVVSVLSVKIPFIDFYCFIFTCIVANNLLIQPKLN